VPTPLGDGLGQRRRSRVASAVGGPPYALAFLGGIGLGSRSGDGRATGAIASDVALVVDLIRSYPALRRFSNLLLSCPASGFSPWVNCRKDLGRRFIAARIRIITLGLETGLLHEATSGCPFSSNGRAFSSSGCPSSSSGSSFSGSECLPPEYVNTYRPARSLSWTAREKIADSKKINSALCATVSSGKRISKRDRSVRPA
jgi:hypothetical protein